MGALEDIIFQSLGGAAKPDFTAGDPYAEPNQFVTQTLQTPILQAALKPDRGGYGTGELIGGALISGLLGGGLSGLSKDYQDTQKGLYRDYLLGNLLKKDSVSASPDLEPSLLDVGQQNLSLFGVLDKLEGARAERDAGIANKKLLAEALLKSEDPEQVLQNAQALGMVKPTSSQNQPAIVGEGSPESPLSAIRKLPKSLEGDARKELTALGEAEKMKGFAAAQFDEAVKIPSVWAALPYTDSSNAMDGVAQSLKTTVQKFLGREMNGPEQERFLTMLPDWNDTESQIQDKKKRYMEMLDSMMPSAPILTESNIIKRKSTSEGPPAGYEFTGKVDSAGRRQIRRTGAVPLG